MSWTSAPRLVGLAISACAASACGFQASTTGFEAVAIDSSVDVYIPDAAPCQAFTSECIGSGSTLRQCTQINEEPVDTPCTWGCLTDGGAHCGALQPSGGTLAASDLDAAPLLTDVTVETGMASFIDTETGEIGGVRAAGTGTISGIDFLVRGSVGVFKFHRLTMTGGTIAVRGKNALALVSITDMTIGATLDLQGACTGTAAGPGGFDGGTLGHGAGGSGAGAGGLPSLIGGGCFGGGGGANGGDGGDAPVVGGHGRKFGTDAITALVGGGGGGGGFGGGMPSDTGGEGGGGGGAVQLVANERVTITGGIQAGGCGGKAADQCGGGGGAGGTILIEAAVIAFKDSKLAVNGGGGAGGDGGTAGQAAQLSATRANGGPGGNSGSLKGGDGGDGGDDGALNGGIGELDARSGAGGGGVGRMRFNSLSSGILTSGEIVFSPAVSTSGQTTTVTKGQAKVQ